MLHLLNRIPVKEDGEVQLTKNIWWPCFVWDGWLDVEHLVDIFSCLQFYIRQSVSLFDSQLHCYDLNEKSCFTNLRIL